MSDVPCNHCGLYYTHRNSCITLIEPTKLRMRDLENRQISEPIIFELLSENKKLKEQLAKAVEVIRYSESQFRYIYNVSNRVDVSECASYSGNKSRDFLDKIKEVEL